MLKKLKSYFSDQSFRFAPIIKDIFVAIENKKHKKDVKIYPHLYPSYNFQGKIKGFIFNWMYVRFIIINKQSNSLHISIFHLWNFKT